MVLTRIDPSRFAFSPGCQVDTMFAGRENDRVLPRIVIADAVQDSHRWMLLERAAVVGVGQS